VRSLLPVYCQALVASRPATMTASFPSATPPAPVSLRRIEKFVRCGSGIRLSRHEAASIPPLELCTVTVVHASETVVEEGGGEV
jgi:hypothetical protein